MVTLRWERVVTSDDANPRRSCEGSHRGGAEAVMIERRDGETPLGGVYTLTVWLDAEGAECDRSVATTALVAEYSADDEWLGETVLRFE
jgi:hypothetical protein